MQLVDVEIGEMYESRDKIISLAASRSLLRVYEMRREDFPEKFNSIFPNSDAHAVYLQTGVTPKSLVDALGDGAEFYIGDAGCDCNPGTVDIEKTALIGSFDDMDSLVGIVNNDGSERLVYMISGSSCCWIYSPVTPEAFMQILDDWNGS